MPSVHRRFAVTGCLGRGGFGEVYRAEMSSASGASVPVALKMLRRDVAVASQAVLRLHDEARALAQLNHPSIVRIYDLAVLDGRTTLITELIEGEDLSDVIRSGPLPPRVLVEVVGRVADALDAAYNSISPRRTAPLGLIHRDVKPSNIRISRSGDVRLLDFGIARSDSVTREALTQTDMLVGSPQYMAPERYFSEQPEPASDVFSLGAVLVEGAVRQRLFEQPMPVLASLAIDRARFEAHVDERLARIADPGVRALAARLLRYDLRSRPTARDVVEECIELMGALEGPDLATFCRARAWAEPPRLGGEMVGRVLVDEQFSREPTERLDRGPPPRRAVTTVRQVDPSGRLARWGAMYLGVLGLGAVTIVVSTIAAAIAYSESPLLPKPPVEPARSLVLPAPSAPPAPVPAEVVSPAGSEEVSRSAQRARSVVREPPPAPSSAAPAPAERPPEPGPEPAPPERPQIESLPIAAAAAEPSPAPEPTVARVRTTIDLDGLPGVATLSGNGVEVKLPADVPAGDYRLRILQADGVGMEFDVSVPATDRPHQIVCGARMHTCR